MRHGVCVPFTCPNISQEFYFPNINDSNVQSELTSCYNEKYKHLGLKGQVTNLICETTERVYPIDNLDIAVG